MLWEKKCHIILKLDFYYDGDNIVILGDKAINYAGKKSGLYIILKW